ncbi:MAG: hypothetical protein GF330_00805 [Candidatus Eisenbacteria bacterium]|nr:hypothetical protein [Candidatus Eisenbacteria bacterium]
MPRRRAVCLLAIPLLLPFVALTAEADPPCALSFWPHLFYTGFEDGVIEGLVRTPEEAWGPGNNNTALEVQDMGPDTWCKAWIVTGFNWYDHVLQASVQYKEGANELGLLYHFQDPSNYYAFMLRNGDEACLMRCVNGEVDRVETAPCSYEPDRWYVLRVETAGALHCAWVNGDPVLMWSDSGFDHGTGGLMARNTRAWFDNVTGLIRPIPPLLHESPPAVSIPELR